MTEQQRSILALIERRPGRTVRELLVAIRELPSQKNETGVEEGAVLPRLDAMTYDRLYAGIKRLEEGGYVIRNDERGADGHRFWLTAKGRGKAREFS